MDRARIHEGIRQLRFEDALARCSSIAIETSLALRLVFQQPLRETEGLLRSIANALKVDIAIPDHTTIMWTVPGRQCLSRNTMAWTVRTRPSAGNDSLF